MSAGARRHLLLTGASGMLGAAILERFRPSWRVTALVGRHRVVLPDVKNVVADLASPETAAEAVKAARPDVVLHAAAWTDVDACESDPARARVVHRDATRALAEAASAVGAALVYVSTDAVFSREGGLHREQDPIDPRSVYARTKREGEEAALEASERALAVRTAIVGFGAQGGRTSLVEWLLRELRAGREVRGFTDVRFTPIVTTTFAAALAGLVDRDARGLLHVAGGECISKYDFAVRLAEGFGLSRGLVLPSSVAGAALRAPRPRAPCLDCARFAGLSGERPQTIDEVVRELRRLEETGFRERARAAIEP